MPPDYKDKLMHAQITIDGEVLMADAPPGHFQKPQGVSVSLQVEIPTMPRSVSRRWPKAARDMPFGKTFFSKGFGMCIDQFGIPWMVNCPKEDM